jgi:hypothetical protein
MGEAARSLVERLEQGESLWWAVSAVLAVSGILSSLWWYALGKAAGRREMLNWLYKNPAGGYQMLEERRKQEQRGERPG